MVIGNVLHRQSPPKYWNQIQIPREAQMEIKTMMTNMLTELQNITGTTETTSSISS